MISKAHFANPPNRAILNKPTTFEFTAGFDPASHYHLSSSTMNQWWTTDKIGTVLMEYSGSLHRSNKYLIVWLGTILIASSRGKIPPYLRMDKLVLGKHSLCLAI